MAETPTPPLNANSPIVDPQSGKPKPPFILLINQLLKGSVSSALAIAQRALEVAKGASASVTKLSKTKIIAGVGLDGGGPISADVTLNLENTAVTPDTYGDATHVPQLTVDAQGRITSVVDVAITGGGGGSGPEAWNVTATGTGSVQNITLPEAGLPTNRVLVFVAGVRKLVSSYSISGTTITLTASSGDAIEIIRGVGSIPAAGARFDWRIVVSLTNAGGFPALGGLEVRPVAGVTNHASGGVPTVSSTLFGSASEAWNPTTSAAWVSNGAPPQWAAYHFAAPVACVEFAVTSSITYHVNEGPQNFTIEYFDGSAWIAVKSVTGQLSWGAGEQRLFAVP